MRKLVEVISHWMILGRSIGKTAYVKVITLVAIHMIMFTLLRMDLVARSLRSLNLALRRE